MFCKDVCQEKNSIEDKLRAKFEYEIKMKLDDLRRDHEKIVNELNNELNYLKANGILDVIVLNVCD